MFPDLGQCCPMTMNSRLKLRVDDLRYVSHQPVTALLQEASFDMCEVDWVVANAGADIRHLSSDGASWLDDDKWEEHIDWR